MNVEKDIQKARKAIKQKYESNSTNVQEEVEFKKKFEPIFKKP